MSSHAQQRTIGKYTFPIYSHPLFRAQVSDNAYVQQRVEAELQQQDMQAAMEDLVERLLAEGREGASEADIELLLQQQLGALDPFFARSAGEGGGEGEGEGVGGGERPTAGSTYKSQKNAFWGTETARSGRGEASDSYIGADALQARPTTYTLTASQRRQPSPPPARLTPLTSSVGGGTTGASPPAHVSVKHSKLMPDLAPSVVSQNNYATPPLEQAASTTPSQTTGSPPHHEQFLPQWRSAMRTTVYSLLHLKMEEQAEDALDGGHTNSNGKHITIAQVESSRQHQRAIDKDQLCHLSPEAYGMMDVLMDGNSTCISRRTNQTSNPLSGTKRLTPMQMSQRLQEQKRLEQEQQQLQQAPRSSGRLYVSGAGSMDPKTRRAVNEHQKTVLRKQQQQQEQQQTAYMGFSGMPPRQQQGITSAAQPAGAAAAAAAAAPRSSLSANSHRPSRSGGNRVATRSSMSKEVQPSSDRWSRGTAYERAMLSVKSFGK